MTVKNEFSATDVLTAGHLTGGRCGDALAALEHADGSDVVGLSATPGPQSPAPAAAPAPARRESITAYVYAYNEERNIAECIKSVQWCDEILVVDSYSKDRTLDIARSLGARVVQNSFEGYREQAQFALEQVGTDWALRLDADERVSPELRCAIETMLAAPDPAVAGFRFGRATRHLGVLFRYGTLFKRMRRLARTRRCRWDGLNPHCSLSVDGAVHDLPGDFLHFRDRDLATQAAVHNKYSSQKAEEMYARGQRAGALAILLRPLARFIKSFVVKQGFRHGTAGLIAALEESAYDFYKYAKLWEKSRPDDGKR